MFGKAYKSAYTKKELVDSLTYEFTIWVRIPEIDVIKVTTSINAEAASRMITNNNY